MSGRRVRGGVRWRGRRWKIAAVAAATAALAGSSALALAGPAAAALPPGCLQSGTTVTCTYGSGGVYGFTVPAGVQSITVTADGAQGASEGYPGGLGGEVLAMLAVTPGQSVEAAVGSAGGTGGNGGYDGGGAGGAGGVESGTQSYGFPGGGGGGASDVRTGTCASTLSCGLAARVVVAGGGGGATNGNVGGAGGYPSGGAGETTGFYGGGGGGGSQSAAGAGGAASQGGIDPCTNAPGAGGSGGQGYGGGGGGGGSAYPSYVGDGGGGGGGGYWGGGGGGGGCPADYAGAGGGGSSYGPAGATFTNNTHAGDGLVTISYTVPTGTVTATTLASSDNQPVVGQQVSYTATVTPAPDGGTVTFDDNGATVCDAVPVSAGTATCQVTYPNPGSHSITAGYSGDPNFQASATTSPLDVTVSQAATSTSLAATPNPSVPGQQVTFTAAVSVQSPGAGAPTGTVTFYDGTAILGTATLSTSAGETLAVFSTDALVAGDHSISASYAGDTDFAGSTTGSALLQSVTDADLSIAQAGDLSVDATSAAGAVVSYPLPQVSDPDEATVPSAVCTPAPGSTFPIGTTTVTCDVTDSDDAGSPVSTSFTVQVRSLLTVVTTSLPTAKVRTWYSTTLQASGGEAPYTWSLAPGSAPLPNGLTLSPSGVISGIPVTGGQVKVIVQVTDSAAAPTTATQTLTIRVGGRA